MFFNAFAPALKSSPFTVLLSMTPEGVITACFIPNPNIKEAAKELRQPFQLTGTAQELDQECAKGIMQIATSYAALSEQVEAAKAVMDAASRARTDAATKAISSKGGGTRSAAAPVKVTASAAQSSQDDDDDQSGDGDGDASPNSESSAPAPAAAPKNDSPFGELAL